MNIRHIVFSVVLSSWAALAAAQHIAIPDWDNAVHFQVLASQDKVRPGDAFEVALVATIRPGYHLYGPEEPEPSRTAVTVESDAFEAKSPEYPPVIRRDLSGLGEYDLYEGEVAIRVPLQASEKLGPGTHAASLEVAYQICTDTACSAPTSDTFTVELESTSKGASVKKLHEDIFPKR